MAKQQLKTDVNTLYSICGFRAISISQLAILCDTSQQMVRRRIRSFEKQGLVETTSRGFGKSMGRPEKVVFLSFNGLKYIQKSGMVGENVSIEENSVMNSRIVEHQLMLNWIRLHLMQLNHEWNEISLDFLSPVFNSESYRIRIENKRIGSLLIPDGIFSITHKKQNKSLLFFLEVDRGTETLVSKNPLVKDIRNKIVGYQEIFSAKSYKNFDRNFGHDFKGFRVLFVSASEKRFEQINRLIRRIPQTDFVWNSTIEIIKQLGIFDQIWAKGDNVEGELFSILGPSIRFRCPDLVSK